jgi:hypothetical protein
MPPSLAGGRARLSSSHRPSALLQHAHSAPFLIAVRHFVSRPSGRPMPGPHLPAHQALLSACPLTPVSASYVCCAPPRQPVVAPACVCARAAGTREKTRSRTQPRSFRPRPRPLNRAPRTGDRRPATRALTLLRHLRPASWTAGCLRAGRAGRWQQRRRPGPAS